MALSEKMVGMLVEYLDEGRLRAGLALREHGDSIVLAEGGGKERRVARDLVLVRHAERPASRENLKAMLAELDEEKQRLRAELDLNLLWEIVREDPRAYSASALAGIFFGHNGPVEVAVMFEALFNDRLYFLRRHMNFAARDLAQVERLRTQYEQIQARSEGGRQLRRQLSAVLEGAPSSSLEENAAIIDRLTRYLANPFARDRETVTLVEAVAGELAPAEAAYEILERLGARPSGPRYAVIGGLRTEFSAAALAEAEAVRPRAQPPGDAHRAITIDDEETVEIDDAIAGERTVDGGFRVHVHIALVADFVVKGGAMDKEAAARGTTVYLPETTVRMLPDPISTDAATLSAGKLRHVLTTEATLSAEGEVVSFAIYPEMIEVSGRLTYAQADAILAGEPVAAAPGNRELLEALQLAGAKLRERRRRAGAHLIHRREAKIVVSAEEAISIGLIDSDSPSRKLVAELMVLSNHLAARMAAERGLPMIYRVQPNFADEGFMQRPRLSLHPEFHAGVGLDCYVQASSPIRRYVDLVLQRQLVAMLAGETAGAYAPEELLAVLAAAENVESEGRELERRARRYWTLTYLERNAMGRPLTAIVMRDGASAELEDFAIRGALRGAPNLPTETRVAVRVPRIDPLRGTLTLTYLHTLISAEESAL